MRRYSPNLSPSRQGYGGRPRSPPRGRPEELGIPFEPFGPVKDVYLPKDYYTGEPHGFGLVQFVDPQDAAEAQYQMDGQFIGGLEITVLVAEENRKKPEEMRMRSRIRSPGRRDSESPKSRSMTRSRSCSRSVD